MLESLYSRPPHRPDGTLMIGVTVRVEELRERAIRDLHIVASVKAEISAEQGITQNYQ